MKRGPPTAPPPQPQLLARKKEHIGRQLISLPERFWEWVVDTVDVNHDELLAFFRYIPRFAFVSGWKFEY